MIIDMFKRADNTLYGADRPSPAGAIAFLDMFSYALVFTLIRLYHRRNGTPNIIGASFLFLGTPLLETVGFGIRLPSLNDPNNLTFFMANQIILGFAPLYLTAVNYIVFSSLVFSVGERFSAWKSKTMLILTIVFICQLLHLEIRGLACAFNFSEDQGYRNAGSGIMLGGLGLDLAMWIIYMILFTVFIRRYFTENSFHSREGEASRVRVVSTALLINIIVYPIRTIFRIVEFSIMIRTGDKVDILWFYIFDASMTFVGVMAFGIFLPYDLPFGNTFKEMCKKNQCGCDHQPPAYEGQNGAEDTVIKPVASKPSARI